MDRAGVLRKCCGSVAGVLWEYCGSIAELLAPSEPMNEKAPVSAEPHVRTRRSSKYPHPPAPTHPPTPTPTPTPTPATHKAGGQHTRRVGKGGRRVVGTTVLTGPGTMAPTTTPYRQAWAWIP